MYDETLRGMWVRRAYRKRHLVESVVAGALVTNCGRRLTAEGWQQESTSNVSDTTRFHLLCKQCIP